MYIYFSYAKSGAIYRWGTSGTKYVVYKLSDGTTQVAEANIGSEIGTTGIYYQSIDVSSWDDGWYLVHMYVSGKSTKKFRYSLILIEGGDVISATIDANIDSILAKMPTNYCMGSSDVDDHDGDFEAVTLAAKTHTGAVVPTVNTLTGHTPQTGDSYARLGAPAGASVSADIAENQTDLDDILAEAQKLDSAAMKAASAVESGSFADLILNKNGSKTYDRSTDSLEAIRDNQSGGGGSGADTYELRVYANAAASTQIITLGFLKNGQIVSPTEASLTITRRSTSGSSTTVGTLTLTTPGSDGLYDEVLPGTYTAGNVYIVRGTVVIDGTTYTVMDGFTAQ